MKRYPSNIAFVAAWWTVAAIILIAEFAWEIIETAYEKRNIR